MGKGQVNILITAASRRVALIRAFTEGLAKNGVTGKVIATDSDPLSPGLFFCAGHHIVPLTTSPDFIPLIKEICRKEKINLLIPTIDEELALFGRYKKEFLDLGVRVLVSDEEVDMVCNDKYKTSRFFREHGLPFAETWLPEDLKKDAPQLPLFIKPRFGRGSLGAFAINTPKELEFFLGYVKDPVIQRFLPGKEYTVDVLCDFDGRVISIVPRHRMVIRSGVCDRGRTEKNPRLMELAEKAARELRLVGAANLQCKVDGDDIVFFEVNARFSGAIQLTINAGADFPRMIIKMMNGGVAPCIGEFKENLTMVSYEESLFSVQETPLKS